MTVSCSSKSITNPSTGRCKVCRSFGASELKKIARSQKVKVYSGDTKEDLCDALIKHFKGKMTKSKSTRSKSRSSTKNTRSKGTRSSYYRTKAPRKVRTYNRRGETKTRKSYPTSGKGSFQKRHHSSKRKGPSLPAQAHCGEIAQGNDGNMWESRPNKNDVCRWYRL